MGLLIFMKKKVGDKSVVKLRKSFDRDWRGIFGALVIGFAVISFWRGLWGLWDVYVYPSNYVLSLWISMVVGLIILFLDKRLIRQFAY